MSENLGRRIIDVLGDNSGVLLPAIRALMAQAFDEGQKSGMRHADRLVAAAQIGRPELPGPLSHNPYLEAQP